MLRPMQFRPANLWSQQEFLVIPFLLLALFSVGRVRADDLTTASGHTFHNVQVTSRSNTTLVIQSTEGQAVVPIADLKPADKERFSKDLTKAMTPGCTAQACSLRDAYQTLQEKGVKVFGVSLDAVDQQKQFQSQEHLPFELLSDGEHKVTAAFGVPLIKESFATRQAYLFKDGRLVWLDTKASTDKQAADVLAVLAGNTQAGVNAGNSQTTGKNQGKEAAN